MINLWLNARRQRIDSANQRGVHVTMWHLYLIECHNGAYYAGITNDLAARYAAHVAGQGAKYTKGNPPLRLLGSRAYPDRPSASRAEWEIKRLPKSEKLAYLIDS